MKALHQLFDIIYKGNKEAATLSWLLWDIAQVWDDLVDGEHVSKTDINRAFVGSLVTVQMNPLWGPDIASAVLNTYLQWSDANAIESDTTSTDEDLAKAWMLRAGIYDIFVMLAAKLYGLDWAVEVGPLVRKTYGEGLEDFITEVRHA